MSNPLIDVQKFGQSICYDNIRRGLIASGELYSMIEHDDLLGVTSKASIFAAALPGQKYTFGILNQVGAPGDFRVLAEHGRRVLRDWPSCDRLPRALSR
jgi:hypothetical protein